LQACKHAFTRAVLVGENDQAAIDFHRGAVKAQQVHVFQGAGLDDPGDQGTQGIDFVAITFRLLKPLGFQPVVSLLFQLDFDDRRLCGRGLRINIPAREDQRQAIEQFTTTDQLQRAREAFEMDVDGICHLIQTDGYGRDRCAECG
jgi:hypothetical protein